MAVRMNSRNIVNYYNDIFNFSLNTIIGLKKFCGEEEYSPEDLYKSKKLTKPEYSSLQKKIRFKISE